MTDVLTIAVTELKRRIRSRSAVVNAFIAPLALAVVFGSLIQGASSASFPLAVVDAGGTPLSAGVVEGILGFADEEGAAALDFRSVATADGARSLVEDGDVGSALLIGSDGSIEVIKNAERPISAQVGESIANTVVGSIRRGDAEPIILAPASLGGRPVDVMAYYGAGMAGLLLFFTVGLAAKSMLEDRDNSTLPRMLSGPTSARAILVGKVIAVVTLSVLGFVVVWLVTTFAFGAEWGSPVGVVILIVATTLAIGGVATFLGSLTRTPQQADTFTAVAGFLFALAGGAFIPPADTPAGLRILRNITPNGLSLRGFTTLSADAGALADILPVTLGLVAIAAVFGLVGLTRVERAVTP